MTTDRPSQRPPETREPGNVSHETSKRFERDGLTVELARERAAAYRRMLTRKENLLTRSYDLSEEARTYWHGEYGSTRHDNAFYLNASDALDILHHRANVKGKSVLTVAGSGDFLQIFLLGGAKEIVAFDISVPGILFNELKLAALRVLSYEEYQSLFDIGTDQWNYGFATTESSKATYGKIRMEVSAQTRAFFDETVGYDKGLPGILNVELFDDRTENPLLIVRPPERDIRWPQTVGTIVTGPEEYLRLQTGARQTDVRFRLQDITANAFENEKPSQLVYLSNIGYSLARTAFLARRALASGSERVLWTTQPGQSNLWQQKDGSIAAFDDYDPKTVEWTGRRPKEGRSVETNRLGVINGRWVYPDALMVEQMIARNECFVQIGDLRTRLVGISQDVGYGMVFEADSKDNPGVR